ncbi:MAG TPA: hypothetical protein VFL53_20470 [Pseudolabrys sp.]|nr:hypothetical protein [Pseudolabrys sp.]
MLEVFIGTGYVIKVLGTEVPTLMEKLAGAFSFLACLAMSRQTVFSWLLVSDNWSFCSIEDEAGFAFMSFDPLLALATERPDRSAIVTTLKNVLVFIGNYPSKSNRPCSRNTALARNVPSSKRDSRLNFVQAANPGSLRIAPAAPARDGTKGRSRRSVPEINKSGR